MPADLGVGVGAGVRPSRSRSSSSAPTLASSAEGGSLFWQPDSSDAPDDSEPAPLDEILREDERQRLLLLASHPSLLAVMETDPPGSDSCLSHGDADGITVTSHARQPSDAHALVAVDSDSLQPWHGDAFVVDSVRPSISRDRPSQAPALRPADCFVAECSSSVAYAYTERMPSPQPKAKRSSVTPLLLRSVSVERRSIADGSTAESPTSVTHPLSSPPRAVVSPSRRNSGKLYGLARSSTAGSESSLFPPSNPGIIARARLSRLSVPAMPQNARKLFFLGFIAPWCWVIGGWYTEQSLPSPASSLPHGTLRRGAAKDKHREVWDARYLSPVPEMDEMMRMPGTSSVSSNFFDQQQHVSKPSGRGGDTSPERWIMLCRIASVISMVLAAAGCFVAIALILVHDVE